MLNVDKTPEIKNNFCYKRLYTTFLVNICATVDYVQFTLTVPWKPVCDQ